MRWKVFPLTILAIAASGLLSNRWAAGAASPAHEVRIAASQFAFSPDLIAVVAGEPVRLVIHSDDAVHGFAIGELHIDVRIPRGGEPVTIDFIAPPPGRYEVTCSEFCGRGHVAMKAALISTAPVRTRAEGLEEWEF
jgi:cytochrome c oxidase subunit 2